MYKRVKLFAMLEGATFIQGAMFIQGGTFIPDSRVSNNIATNLHEDGPMCPTRSTTTTRSWE